MMVKFAWKYAIPFNGRRNKPYSENMIYDPLINSADDLQYLLEIIGSLEDTRVGACVDTCHYGISKKAFDAIRSPKIN